MKTMIRSRLAKQLVSLCILSMLFLPLFAHATTESDILTNLDATKLGSSASATPLPEIIGDIIKLFLGFLGIVLVILIMFAGFKWMTAGGDAKKVDDAKAMIKNAVIGTALILVAYIITVFVITQISKATGGGGQ